MTTPAHTPASAPRDATTTMPLQPMHVRPTPERRADAYDVAAYAAPPAHATNIAPARVRNWLIAICLLAFALRVGAIFALHAWRSMTAMEHDTIARMIVSGRGFRFIDWGVDQYTSVQSPLCPYVLAGFFKLFGVDAGGTGLSYLCVMLINAVLGAASCALVYAMVRALRGTALAGLVAAALVAVWPSQIYATTYVQAITFITCCTIAVIWLFYRAVETRRLGPWIGYGLIGCLGALTEPVLLPFMAFSGLLILVWPRLPIAIRLRNAAVLLACAALVIGPWAYRNYLVHGAVVPVKSTFWVNVWKGNNPNATGTDRLPLSDEQRAAIERGLTDEEARDTTFDNARQYDRLAPDQKAELTGKPEVEREKIFARYAKTFIRENPARYAQLCATRLWKTLWGDADNPKSRGLKQTLFYWAPRTILLAFTPFALFVAWRRGVRMTVPLLIVGSALATYTLTIAAARFALPYEPWQLALIAILLTPSPPYLGERAGARR